MVFSRLVRSGEEDGHGLTDADFDIETPGKAKAAAPPPPKRASRGSSALSPGLLRPVNRGQYDTYIARLRRPEGLGVASSLPAPSPGGPQEEQAGYATTVTQEAAKCVVEATRSPGVCVPYDHCYCARVCVAVSVCARVVMCACVLPCCASGGTVKVAVRSTQSESEEEEEGRDWDAGC